MAPEIIKEEAYDSKVDMWSLFVVFYVLAVDKLPFGIGMSDAAFKRDDKEVLEDVPMTDSGQQLTQRSLQRLQRMESVAFRTTVYSFLRFMLQRDPAQRPCAADALKKVQDLNYYYRLGNVDTALEPGAVDDTEPEESVASRTDSTASVPRAPLLSASQIHAEASDEEFDGFFDDV